MQKIIIAGMARTPMGGFMGSLSSQTAAQLGAVAIKAAIERANLNPAQIDETIMGCVLPAGQGQAPARQAAIFAGIPNSIGATTINKMCGSGMKAIMLAHDLILAGSGKIMVAGGMESMSNAPYLLPKARAGYRLGHGQVVDHMFLDGLEDAYDKGRLMGTFAEECASEFAFTRQAQDEFAISSLKRAQNAINDGSFKAEVASVSIKAKSGETLVETDEQPLNARMDKIPTLKPAFKTDGSVTAANSSSISDGAAALVITTEENATALGLSPIATIVAHTTHAHEPSKFTTAPIGAIEKLLQKTGWDIQSVDLFEINEAFAVVTMAAISALKLDPAKVNVHGGACALGHPIGASGARIVISLIAALQKYGKKRGIAAICIGGGEATAIAIEI